MYKPLALAKETCISPKRASTIAILAWGYILLEALRPTDFRHGPAPYLWRVVRKSHEVLKSKELPEHDKLS